MEKCFFFLHRYLLHIIVYLQFYILCKLQISESNHNNQQKEYMLPSQEECIMTDNV